jgi:hypothetical protein
MAKRRKRKRENSNKVQEGGKVGSIAIVLIIGLVALMVWGTFNLKKPTATISGDADLPDYAYVSARSEQSYRISLDPSITSEDVFSKLPCYCGCKDLGHKDLKACFLDEHGSFCTICQAEAIDAYEMKGKDLSIAQIRYEIDEKYGYGRFAEGTETPPVA